MQCFRSIKFSGLLLCVMGITLSTSALAVEYSCAGVVNGVTVGPSGVVSAESAGGQHWGYFCQLGVTSNNVSPDACKGILATLLAAQTSGKQVQLWYNDSLNCSANRGWAWLNAWYWGPEMVD